MLRRQKHALSQRTTPFACTLFRLELLREPHRHTPFPRRPQIGRTNTMHQYRVIRSRANAWKAVWCMCFFPFFSLKNQQFGFAPNLFFWPVEALGSSELNTSLGYTFAPPTRPKSQDIPAIPSLKRQKEAPIRGGRFVILRSSLLYSIGAPRYLDAGKTARKVSLSHPFLCAPHASKKGLESSVPTCQQAKTETNDRSTPFCPYTGFAMHKLSVQDILELGPGYPGIWVADVPEISCPQTFS